MVNANSTTTCRCVPPGVGIAPPELSVDDEIRLERFRLQDSAPLYDLMNDNRSHMYPFQQELLDWYETLEDAFDYMQEVDNAVKRRTMAPYKIFYQDVPAPIGTVKLHSRVDRRAQIGYMLGEDYTGLGIATRAAARLIEFGFKDWGLDEVYARLEPANIASRGVARRLGASFERRAYQSGREYEVWRITHEQ